MKVTIWDQLVWRYCVNAEDKRNETDTTAQAGEETLFWFKIEVSTLMWVTITLLLPGQCQPSRRASRFFYSFLLTPFVPLGLPGRCTCSARC